MAKSMELAFIIGAGVAGALTGLAKITKSIKTLKDNTEELSKTAKKLESFDKAREKLNNINKEYLESVNVLKKLKAEQLLSGQENAKLAKKIQDAEKHVSKLNDKKQNQLYAFQKARSSIEAEGHSFKTYRNTLAKVNKELEVNRRLKEVQAKHENRMNSLNNVQQYT